MDWFEKTQVDESEGLQDGLKMTLLQIMGRRDQVHVGSVFTINITPVGIAVGYQPPLPEFRITLKEWDEIMQEEQDAQS